MITVSVPGKIFLMGEHAVVYGKPAIIAAINRRLTVSVDQGNNTATGYVADILAIVQKHFKTNISCSIKITSDIPQGYHVGSSAAVAVGVVAATSYFLKKVWNPALFNQLAYEAEKLQHGNPSGADNTAVTFGGLIWYRKELEFLKSIWQLPFKPKLDSFYLVNTGKPKETTGEMVAFVAKQKGLHKFLEENEEQTKRITVALKEGDEKTFINAMQKGEKTLEQIGVVSKKVVPIIRSIEKAGGAAKILGGGGRADGVGYLLCYSHHPPKGSEPITVGEEGIRLENNL
jgi:mevalonate kinase